MFTLRYLRRPAVLGLLTALVSGTSARLIFAAGQAASPNVVPHIVEPFNDAKLVPLAGNTHPLAIAKFDQGAVPESLPLEHMFLQLRRNPDQEEALENRLRELQDPHSANY